VRQSKIIREAEEAEKRQKEEKEKKREAWEMIAEERTIATHRLVSLEIFFILILINTSICKRSVFVVYRYIVRLQRFKNPARVPLARNSTDALDVIKKKRNRCEKM